MESSVADAKKAAEEAKAKAEEALKKLKKVVVTAALLNQTLKT